MEKSIETKATERLREALNDDAFSLKQNVTYRKGAQITVIDIAIYHQNMPIAIVEVKENLSIDNEKQAISQITKALNIVSCKSGIITDGETFRYFNDNTWLTFSLDKLVEKLKETIAKQPEKKIADEIRPILENNNFNLFYPSIIEDSNGCRFDSGTEEYFWETILGERPSKIYRYISFDSIFQSIKNKSFRMNGIVGMNDRSEISYFDDYCCRNKKPSYRSLDSVYLSSCSVLDDDLTMWRLYGDNAKGVCLEFEVQDVPGCDFLLYPVSYPDKETKNQMLEMVKKMINLGFHFEYIDKWKYFFKSQDYAVEKEIRLLYIDDDNSGITGNKDWVKTYDSSIINPIIDFGIDDPRFPLKLKTIIIGSKCPEKETNIMQLSELINTKLRLNINVESSKIKNYR